MAEREDMREENGGSAMNTEHRPRLLPAVTLVIVLFAAVGMAWLYNMHFEERIGPRQPIPFSHRLHAGMKKISCVMCHEGALSASNAGIPPLQTCMLCHERIIIAYPPIQELRAAYVKGEPVQWVNVTDLPDFVYFTHGVHLAQRIDCSRCHGDVREMDRIELVEEFTMGFCIQCHRDRHATIDCFTCHR